MQLTQTQTQTLLLLLLLMTNPHGNVQVQGEVITVQQADGRTTTINFAQPTPRLEQIKQEKEKAKSQ